MDANCQKRGKNCLETKRIVCIEESKNWRIEESKIKIVFNKLSFQALVLNLSSNCVNSNYQAANRRISKLMCLDFDVTTKLHQNLEQAKIVSVLA